MMNIINGNMKKFDDVEKKQADNLSPEMSQQIDPCLGASSCLALFLGIYEAHKENGHHNTSNSSGSKETLTTKMKNKNSDFNRRI